VRDQYGKAKFIQVEALSSWYYFANRGHHASLSRPKSKKHL